jgi:hypothetical protein
VWWLCLATATVAMEGDERLGHGHGLLDVDGSPSRARSVDCCCLLPADFGRGEGSGEARCGRKGWGPARGAVVVAMVVEVAAVDGRI